MQVLLALFIYCNWFLNNCFISEEFFLTDPELVGGTPSELLSHEDQYRDSIKKSNAILHKIKEREKKVGKVDDYR
jgi:hypothetical protein